MDSMVACNSGSLYYLVSQTAQYRLRHLLSLFVCVCVCVYIYIYIYICVCVCIQGVTGGTDQTSGECSLSQTIPI